MRFAFAAASLASMTVAATGMAQTIVSAGDLTNTTMLGHLGPESYIPVFYTFNANAGDVVTLSASRLTFELDPTMEIYFGSMIGDDAAHINTYMYIATFDDDVDHPGPFGDPLGQITIDLTGTYTIVFYSNGSEANANGYDYSIASSGSTYVPAPGAAAMLGLCGIASARRKRR